MTIDTGFAGASSSASGIAIRGPAAAFFATFSAAIGILGFAFPAEAAGGPDNPDNPEITAAPRQLITETANEIVAVLANREASSEERIKKIEEIAYEIFDFTTMSKLVLARNWKKMSKEQRGDFVREFKRHLARTYGTRLDRYDQEEVEVYGSQVEVRNDVSIKTRIVGGQFDAAEVSYRLRERKDRWRIIDVVIEGVSLVSNYRSQFAEVLNSGTIDDLLTKLRDKNFVVDEGES